MPNTIVHVWLYMWTGARRKLPSSIGEEVAALPLFWYPEYPRSKARFMEGNNLAISFQVLCSSGIFVAVVFGGGVKKVQMGEHLVVHVDQLVKPDVVESSQLASPAVGCGPNGKEHEIMGTSSSVAKEKEVMEEENNEAADEEAPLLAMAECRICQEEDSLNNLESPCACSGSLKYAHRKCVQHWCNEKGDITCEICHQFFSMCSWDATTIRYSKECTSRPPESAPGAYLQLFTKFISIYSWDATTGSPISLVILLLPRPQSDETTIDIGGVWQLSGAPLDVHDPRILAIAEAERQLFEADYDDYNGTNSSGAAFCRSAALILMALLLLRHALSITDADGDGNGGADDDAFTFFSLFLLRVVGFLLPCYIMIWAINILQRRRQRQEAALAATQFAILVQSAQSRGLLVASAAPAVNSQVSPVQEHV
ncbi:RING/FYVE/PHD zinc finger superfamily protein [Abeliophyllum distichum]|uniref:RING/FYVE/PHD zinc finger superfamily protein n=1 Tax=Abeliophyllum distichum TaxID=126358 RepID=A0ABD1RES8_9LAMI